jgi:alcohol dehydrogenase class IV
VIDKKMVEFPIIYSTQMARIAIGWGVHETVADECKKANIKKALITTTGLKNTGIIDEIIGILNYGGISTEVYNKLNSNPRDHQIMEAFQVFKQAACDGVVSVGGGSSHDCGKAIRILEANEGNTINAFNSYMDPPWMSEVQKWNSPKIPQIAVNTTAGTGAEATPLAMYLDTKLKSKSSIMMPGVAPTIGLNDPVLMRLMPENIAAWTGFDALTHAFEGFLARIHNPIGTAIMLKQIQMVTENIREFTFNRMNHIACENMCWAEFMPVAALMMGGGVGIVHGLGNHISGLTDCHHGFINAVISLPAERYNEPAFPDRFAEMAQAMGVDTRDMTKMQAADKWFDEMGRLLIDLNITVGNLNEQIGLQQKDCKHVVDLYSNDIARQGNPRTFNHEAVLKLLEGML